MAGSPALATQYWVYSSPSWVAAIPIGWLTFTKVDGVAMVKSLRRVLSSVKAVPGAQIASSSTRFTQRSLPYGALKSHPDTYRSEAGARAQDVPEFPRRSGRPPGELLPCRA